MEDLLLPDRRAAVATLVATAGSSPRSIGARMWVDDSGAIVGSVTIGGCVDARVIEAASEVLESRRSRVLSLELGEEDAASLGLTCAGTVEVLVEPYDPVNADDPIRRSLELLKAELDAGRRAVSVVPLGGRTRRLVVQGGGLRSGTLGDPDLDRTATTEAILRLESDDSAPGIAELPGARERLFFQVHSPPLSLVIFGATHVATALVRLGNAVGMRTVVVDGRDRFASRDRFPSADELLVGLPSEIAERLELGPSSLVVLLSHDYKYDLPVLRVVMESNASYIGVLGSRRRGKALLEFLNGEGFADEHLARIRVPVGLDIGAKSPSEIALSVLAEALAVARGRSGAPLRESLGGKGGREKPAEVVDVSSNT